MDTQFPQRPSANSVSSRLKRITLACLQCRDRKVRCSGTTPCVNCTRRSETCVFEQEEKKVLVSERFLNELKRKSGHEETESTSRLPRRQRNEATTEDLTAFDDGGNPNDRVHQTSSETSDSYVMTNPLVVSPPKFMTDFNGRRRFLGPSSTWAYGRYVISLLKDHLQYHDLPEIQSNVDGIAFPLDLPKSRLSDARIDLGTLPPLDYAIYLTKTVKFHIGQTYHFFDESIFMENLHLLHHDGLGPMTSVVRLWLCQYFVIMALGIAFLHRGSSKSSPFGKEYFLRGIDVMPDISGLHEDPVLAIETCCAIALYLQSVDHRNTAFVYLGIALRIALSQGIHHDPLDDHENLALSERQRSAWWTLYILDRKFSYMIGSPSQISDDSITIKLPGAPYHTPYEVTAMDVHVKLCKLMGKVTDTIYAVDGRLRVSFLRIMQSTIQDLASIANTMATSIHLKFEPSDLVDRVSGTLSLCYHQCVILATRPLFVCLLRETLKLREVRSDVRRDLAEPIKALVRRASDAATRSLRILSALQARDLLETFLPFDLEYAFSSTFLLQLTTAVDPLSDTVDPHWMEMALNIIDGLIESGHVSARFRREELEHLRDLLGPVSNTEGLGQREAALDDVDNRFGEGVLPGVNLSFSEFMNRHSMTDLETGFLEGDWLWENGFADLQTLMPPSNANRTSQ